MQAITNAILDTPLGALKGVIDGGALPALASGLSHIHRANLAAALSNVADRPVFVICSDDIAAENMARDIAAFTGVTVNVLQMREFTFYSADGVSRQSEHTRIAALDRLASAEAKFTVCSAPALMQRTLPPGRLESAAFTIKSGGEMNPDTAEKKLHDCGYMRSEQVEGQGQFSRRGGILDLFPPGYEYPVRCEFWGDTVDTLALFEIDSQRRIDNIEICRVLPSAETLPAFCEGGIPGLADRIESLRERVERSKNRNEKLICTLSEDIDRLRGAGVLVPADRYMHLIYDKKTAAAEYIPYDAVVFISEPSKTVERARDYAKSIDEDIKNLLISGTLVGNISDFYESWDACLKKLREYAVVMADAFTVGRYPLEPRTILSSTAKQLPSYGGSVQAAAEDVKHYIGIGYRVAVLASDERRSKILCDLLREQDIQAEIAAPDAPIPAPGRCAVMAGGLSSGFEYPEIKLAVLTESQIVRGSFKRAKRKKAVTNRQRLGSYADLSPGDLVVHEYHGIGRFAGIIKMPVEGVRKDYIKICYAGTDSLYVPVTQLDLVSKYIGGGDEKPVRLSKMGGSDWSKTKSRAKAAAKELAKGLITLYAERSRLDGFAFSPDSPWQIEFEQSFGYQETDDQLRSVAEIKTDMEQPRPMDRLLCGDVGYGKTEVALRAVMKCVLDGKQAALLVPTTVLAQQHYQTAMQRFFGYPVKIEVLSRFRTPTQIKQTLQNIRSGAADIVIGTHRIIQKDVVFKDLGLLIIDEEQRFGVSHKERLKEMSRQVDTLTLSATPIPRTMNMALSGLRDMSTIEEPPQDRMPVQTYVMEHDWGVICDAIRREVMRGGQVYYLHNRIENIERTASRLSQMLEDVTVSVAHGRMDEESLSGVMESMAAGECQVLVCTTIIETGIDIPNVNTLIIEDADRLGLAQLHQIRGRVGRSSRRASAYLTFRKNRVLTEIAEKRLSAVREFAEFNSGFKIAMRDLEIRGAGNLLGSEQSGHMISVGYDMYLKLLEEAVLEERGEKPVIRAECSADLAVSANLPEDYVASPEQRMDIYRRIAMIRTEDEADDLLDELIDRFGDPPSGVSTLIHVSLLRGEAANAGISDIAQKSGALKFTLAEFDMEHVSALYGKKEYKGRIKVEGSVKPCLSLRLDSKKRIIDQARTFVADYAGAYRGGSNDVG